MTIRTTASRSWLLGAALLAAASAQLAGRTAAATSVDGAPRFEHAAVAYAAGGAVAQQKKGRFKQEGENCVWDVNDSGPNQCTPVTRGRFKKGGDDSCTWDANDNGPDQCTPPKGRWKKSGSRCTWDPKDSGPNQCNPRQPRK
ncbi:MAG TPA: hypothetical protein VFJ02_21140 [Vicinamibacterales bacterium]|nr:hypothetical protein [Vicinamibacterales bacterium]